MEDRLKHDHLAECQAIDLHRVTARRLQTHIGALVTRRIRPKLTQLGQQWRDSPVPRVICLILAAIEAQRVGTIDLLAPHHRWPRTTAGPASPGAMFQTIFMPPQPLMPPPNCAGLAASRVPSRLKPAA